MKRNQPYFIALLFGVIFNSVMVFYTLDKTYDALIHLFFGSHYYHSWFEPWDGRWYTGFSVMSYPPLVHQLIALFSHVFSFKLSLYFVSTLITLVFISGVYQFSKLLLADRNKAGYAALFAAFSSLFLETLHVFGQLPTLLGIGLLMHSFPYIYGYLQNGGTKRLLKALIIVATAVCSHHVTSIFGLVFFVAPLFGFFLMNQTFLYKQKKKGIQSYKDVRVNDLAYTLFLYLPRVLKVGFGIVFSIIFCVLPYWILSKKDPISQIPIPHGSRDNFLEISSSGLIFFAVPWGVMLLLLPYYFYRLYSRKYFFYGLSFTLLFILGTGGTTPIPKLLLGENAFNILTLDRFTFWAIIIAFPFTGEFIYKWIEGDYQYKYKIIGKNLRYKCISTVLVVLTLFSIVFVLVLGQFRPFQPREINMTPILNFINQDKHYNWRYLTLGFGDQIAWLSSLTMAETVDGNYHSARRLPELTSRAVERLENAKYQGREGLGSLQEMLSNADKYHLKYIFSNDKFYDPLLYFYGWERLSELENDVIIWEKQGVSPLPHVRFKKETHSVLKIMWGVIPVGCMLLMIWLHYSGLVSFFSLSKKDEKNELIIPPTEAKKNPMLLSLLSIWGIIFILFYLFYISFITAEYNYVMGPKEVVKAYYDALDFKDFNKAYSLIYPDETYPKDQFLLENSLEDGILNSYGKLNSIDINILNQTEDYIKMQVHSVWITPLKNITKEEEVELQKEGFRWYVLPKKKDPHIQQDLILSEVTTLKYNPGRRKADINNPGFDDELHQPMVQILQAHLVEKDGNYHIVGELLNRDNYNAVVSIQATLYDEHDRPIASYYVEEIMNHFLLPSALTPFRLDFKSSEFTQDNYIFNPEKNTYVKINTTPKKFILHCKSNMMFEKIYNKLSINQFNPKTKKGMLYNTGVEEVTIPQLIMSYEKEDGTVFWVDNQFINEAIKPQKRSFFQLEPQTPCNVDVIFDGIAFCFVNGIPNKLVTVDGVPNINPPAIPVQEDCVSSYNIFVNNFIGNPK